MVSVEETFGVRLSMNEMAAMKSLPKIVATLEQHLAGAAA
jgi:acyl carrier protein